VLRARINDSVRVILRNEISNRWIGMHLIAEGYAVVSNDGSHVGLNPIVWWPLAVHVLIFGLVNMKAYSLP
jgi:hypothetical protein